TCSAARARTGPGCARPVPWPRRRRGTHRRTAQSRLSDDVGFRERFQLVGVRLPETAQEFERGRRLPFVDLGHGEADVHEHPVTGTYAVPVDQPDVDDPADARDLEDRKSTRLNSSHVKIS